MKNDTDNLKALKERASNNEIEILHSKTCSCFFCRQTYSARSVNDWVNDSRGVTALCPECGMDAVIGDNGGEPLDKVTLKSLNLAYYGEDYMEKHPSAALKYIERYQKGKITHKKTNEALYIQYLSLLARQGNANSAYDLGSLYEFGDEFTPADPKEAFSYYATQSLADDGDALTRLGILSESGVLGKVDERGAYDSFAKAMAMGSLSGLVHFSDCYRKGVGCLVDLSFSYNVLTSIWSETYNRFVASNGKDINIFPDVAYRIALCLSNGFGVEKDEQSSLRFFLFAEFGYNLLLAQNELKGELKDELHDTELHIEALANKNKLSHQDPVFDNDTFADSILDSDSPLYMFVGANSFMPVAYDKSDNTFSFDVTYAVPPLIVDIGNLFCGFVPGTIRWDFSDVAEVKFSKNQTFNRVEGDAEDGYSFYNISTDSKEKVASIAFLSNIPKKKEPVVIPETDNKDKA